MPGNTEKITLKEVRRILDVAELLDEVLTPDERLALRKLASDQRENDSVEQYVLLSILDGETPNNR